MDGSYRFPEDPAEPMLLHLPKVAVVGGGASPRDQSQAGRFALTALAFEDYEHEIRDLLARALGAGGFHPTSDIEAITVNRWSHGYSYEYTELLGPAGGSPEFATFPGPPLDKIGLKPLSPPNISSLGLCNSSREETMVPAMEMPKKSLTSTRGFASMDREKQLAIARKGGESVPNEKRSFSQNRRLAAEAGRKGGQSVNPTKRSFSRNHALASEAGRKGGHASHPGPKIAGDQE